MDESPHGGRRRAEHPETAEPTGLWACGVIGKAHGLRGEVYLNLAADGSRRLSLGTRFYLADPRPRALEGAERVVPCAVTRCGGTDQRPLVRLDLAATREDALALQGRELLAAGGELDELPRYLIGDLLGLRVETAAGRSLGVVRDVLEAPAHEILEIAGDDGRPLLVPLVEELVTVDADVGVVRVVDGLLDDVEVEPEATAGGETEG